ncbi:MAG: hypothetical protein AAF409_11980 [Pseudomonadota bacterium]
MKGIFLGPFIHWMLIAVLAGLGWVAGTERFHVIDFNTFILLVLAATVLAVVLVIKTSAPGQQVTRDPLEDE